MRVLVACEYSGVVRNAFRLKGHEAWSCDILPCESDEKYHYQCDIFEVIDKNWDMMIAHPPCTYLSVTGNRWFHPAYAKKHPGRQQKREDAKAFFMALANAPIEKICIENAQGIMSTYWRKPDQIIQPYQFGHPAAKRTCLWLKNLPPLMHTEIVEPEYVTYKSGKRLSKWYADIGAAKPPPEERRKLRSRTFQGIANSMATQWGTI
jgi:hypothetical protein